MKKISAIIIGLMLPLMAFSQKTVAVYVTSAEGISPETKTILGSELVSAITKANDYIAVERTADFMSQVEQERENYEIDDAKLYDLGKKYGASNVCVAEITKFGDEYYIVARLLDIKTSRVWKTSRKYSRLSSLGELVGVSEALANELFGNTKELSTYANGDNKDNRTFITKIENREAYTKVTLKIVVTEPSQQIGISRQTYIEDVSNGSQYSLINTSNINIIDATGKNLKTINKGVWEYSLFFETIPEDVTNIMIIEPNGYEYKDIVLKPYGDINTFVFEDNAQKLYDELTFTKTSSNNDNDHSSNYNIDNHNNQNNYNNSGYSTNHGAGKTESPADTQSLKDVIVRWDIQSRPQGADVFWRVVSTTPNVKSTNNNYMQTTPYESTKSLDINGLTRQTAGNVRIILRCEKDGYLPQEKEFDVRMILDQEEISVFFKLVKEQ